MPCLHASMAPCLHGSSWHSGNILVKQQHQTFQFVFGEEIKVYRHRLSAPRAKRRNKAYLLVEGKIITIFRLELLLRTKKKTASKWWCSRWWCRWVSCFYYSTESDKNVKSANLHKPSFAQSMPKMPGGDDGEKKEETAESREEAKEQVITILIIIIKF